MLGIETSAASSTDTQRQLVLLSERSIGHSVMDAQTRVIERKSHLFCEGDDATHIFQVEAGHVCSYRQLADGRRQIVDFAYPGDFIGLGAGGQHTSNAQATERTRLRCLPLSALRTIVRKNPKLGLELYEKMSSELTAARELLVSVCQRSARERVAAFLLALSHRNARGGGDPSCIVLPMTRTDIADYLGLNIETVSRMLSKMRKEELIDIEQSILITINDVDALAKIAIGECA